MSAVDTQQARLTEALARLKAMPPGGTLTEREHAAGVHAALGKLASCRGCYGEHARVPEPTPPMPPAPPATPPKHTAAPGTQRVTRGLFERARERYFNAPHFGPPEPVVDQPLPCPECRGQRWVRPNGWSPELQPGHPLFGALEPCPTCYEPEVRSKALQHLLGPDGAGIPAAIRRHAKLESFPVTPRSQASWQQLLAWWRALLEGRAAHNSMFIWGKPSVGKTCTVAAFLVEWSRLTGREGAFLKTTSVLSAIQGTYHNHTGKSADDILRAIATSPFVVLDDLAAGQPTMWVAEKMLQIIGDRHDEGLPLLMTSNLSPDKLRRELVDGSLAHASRNGEVDDDMRESAKLRGDRLFWRIIEMADVVEFKGDNLRDPRVRAALQLPAYVEEPLPLPAMPEPAGTPSAASVAAEEETAF